MIDQNPYWYFWDLKWSIRSGIVNEFNGMDISFNWIMNNNRILLFCDCDNNIFNDGPGTDWLWLVYHTRFENEINEIRKLRGLEHEN